MITIAILFILTSDCYVSVLSSNELCVSSENTVFLALMKWAEVNEVFDDQLEPLLDLVRFKSMTINYLHDVVTSDHPIASTVAKFPLLFEEAVFYHAFSKVSYLNMCGRAQSKGWVGLFVKLQFFHFVFCSLWELPYKKERDVSCTFNSYGGRFRGIGRISRQKNITGNDVLF